MIEDLRIIFRYVRGFLAHTEETWRHLSEPDVPEAQTDYMLRKYYWPLVAFGALCIFLLHGNGVLLNSKLTYDAPFSLEYCMKGAVGFALKYVGGPTLAMLAIGQFFCRVTDTSIKKNNLEIFVYYSMSIVLLIDLFCSFMPTMKFLSFISLFVVYVVWIGSSEYLNIPRGLNGFFWVVSSVSIYFSPAFIELLLSKF